MPQVKCDQCDRGATFTPVLVVPCEGKEVEVLLPLHLCGGHASGSDVARFETEATLQFVQETLKRLGCRPTELGNSRLKYQRL